MLEKVDAAIIGGGVVGLACAAELASTGLRTVLFERHGRLGTETSSRNSEVLHSGMHYPPDTLKAKLCVSGAVKAYAFAKQVGVKHRKIGKITVAANGDEETILETIRLNGERNGVAGLRFMSSRELAEREPNVKAVAALDSPCTGIIDAHSFMESLTKKAESADALLVCNADVRCGERIGDEWRVSYRDSDGDATIRAQTVVNAGGLGGQEIMRRCGFDSDAHGLALHPCKGCYFSLQGEARKMVNGLVYPVPETNLTGLGIHTVVDMGGGIRLGPDTEYVSSMVEYDYDVPESRRPLFFAGAKRYLPLLREEDLAQGMAGIRPKLSGPGEAARDFYIADEKDAGFPGFINLAGIESPGLTASMAIGEMVLSLIRPYVM